jgi:hypothetical protein
MVECSGGLGVVAWWVACCAWQAHLGWTAAHILLLLIVITAILTSTLTVILVILHIILQRGGEACC